MSAPAPITRPQNIAAIPVNQLNNRVSGRLAQTVTPGGAIATTQTVAETRQYVLPVLGGATTRITSPGISYYFEFVGTLGGIPNNFAGLSVRAINVGGVRSDIIHVQGTGLRFGTASFVGLEITNRDPVNTVLFTIDIGGGVPNNSYDEYIDKRVVISQAAGAIVVVNVVGAPLFIQNETTVAVAFKTRVGGWADSLAANTTQDVTDDPARKGRKSIIFANDDLAAVLTVFDATGNILGSIQPTTSWTIDTGGDIKLHNPTANPVTCHIGEVYYT